MRLPKCPPNFTATMMGRDTRGHWYTPPFGPTKPPIIRFAPRAKLGGPNLGKPNDSDGLNNGRKHRTFTIHHGLTFTVPLPS